MKSKWDFDNLISFCLISYHLIPGLITELALGIDPVVTDELYFGFVATDAIHIVLLMHIRFMGNFPIVVSSKLKNTKWHSFPKYVEM